jgi:HK97 family phage major capsid protein
MAIETTASNSTLIASQVQQLLVQPLEQASTFLSAGPQIMDSNKPVRIPRIASGTTAGFVGEGQLISDGNVTFDEIQALPSSLQSIKVWLPVSNELIRGAAVDGLDAILRTRLVTDVANALDKALWDGAGTSNTIKGIFQQTGIQTGVLDKTDIDSLIDALATAQGNHVAPTHWVMTPATFAAFRKIKVGASDARYVIDPSTVQNGTSFQLLGLPVIITDNIPNTSAKARVALVDFSKVAVVRDNDSQVFIADQTLANYDSVAIRVTTRFDVALLQPHAVTVLTEAGS